jgi:hypothetical protein
MYGSTKASIFGCVLVVASVSGAATIEGTFTYDGVAMDSVFSDAIGAKVLAENPADSSSVYGTVNLAAGTFTIQNVTVGQNVSVYLTIDRSQPVNDILPDANDLHAVRQVAISTAGETVAVEMNLLYVLQFTAPVDSSQTVNGYFNQCPVGADVSSPSTVVWTAVPRATSYTVNVFRRGCDYTAINQETIEQSSNSLELTLGTHSEDHTDIRIQCTGGGGGNLCYMPWVHFLDNLVQGYFLHEGGGVGRGTDHANAHFIPAVARSSGVPPTFWSSELVILSTNDLQQNVEVVFTPRNKDGWTNYQTRNINFAANSAQSWDDVLDELFSRDGAGSLEIRGSGLVVSSRTSTPAAGGGSYGLSVPPLAPEDLLMAGGVNEAYAGGLRENEDWRTNFGVCEVSGRSITIRVTIYDNSMTSLGDKTINLGPYQNKQLNRVIRDITGEENTVSDRVIGVEVMTGAGKVGAYLTVIENTTGDSTYVPIAPQTPTGG